MTTKHAPSSPVQKSDLQPGFSLQARRDRSGVIIKLVFRGGLVSVAFILAAAAIAILAFR